MIKVVTEAETTGNLEAGLWSQRHVENMKNVIVFYKKMHIIVQYKSMLVFPQKRWKK